MREETAEKIDQLLSACVRLGEDCQQNHLKALKRNSKVYLLDFFLSGAHSRQRGLVRTLQSAIDATDMFTARVVVRLMLDNAARLYGLRFLSDPEQAMKQLLDEDRFDKLRDVNGVRLTDRVLIERLSSVFPEAQRVYKATSGYVHLSMAHFTGSINEIGDHIPNTVSVLISESQPSFPDESWLEISECFYHLLMLSAKLIVQYAHIIRGASGENSPSLSG